MIDEQHAGDDNHARAVARALGRKIPDADVLEGNIKQLEKLCGENAEPLFVIGAGAHNMQPLAELRQKSGRKNLKISWGSHQYHTDLSRYADQFDYIALPGHTIGQDVRNSLKGHMHKIIKMSGVPHLMTLDHLKDIYNAGSFKIPSAEKGCTCVIMGGDALTPDGNLKFYTPKAAADFARYLVRKGRIQKPLLVTNGPRTGKHDPDTGVDANTHRNFDPETGHAIEYKLDPVTHAFVEALEQEGLKPEQDFYLYDFMFTKDGVSSAYKSLLYSVQKTGGQIYVPGESTSMISEACDFLSPKNVVVYNHEAMNTEHYKFVKYMFRSGRFKFLDMQGQIMRAEETVLQQKHLPDAEHVASEIARSFEPLHYQKPKPGILRKNTK